MFSKLIFVQFVKTSNSSFTSTQASFPNRCWNVSNLIGISPSLDFSCFRLTSNLRFKLFVPNLYVRSGLGLSYLWCTRYYSWDIQYKLILNSSLIDLQICASVAFLWHSRSPIMLFTLFKYPYNSWNPISK